MSKCNHEKICPECVRAEIRDLEQKLQEAKAKLPSTNITIIREYPDRVHVPYMLYYQQLGLPLVNQNNNGYQPLKNDQTCFVAGSLMNGGQTTS